MKGQLKVVLFAIGLPAVTVSAGVLPLLLVGAPVEVGIALAMVPLPLVLWAAVSIWKREPRARGVYRGWAALYMVTYAGPVVFRQPGDQGFVGSVLFTVGLGGVLIAGDLCLRSILLKDTERDPARVGVPQWLGREPLPRWQRRVVAFLLFAPMVLQDLVIAVSVFLGRRISGSAEVGSFVLDMVPALVTWLVFRAATFGGLGRRSLHAQHPPSRAV